MIGDFPGDPVRLLLVGVAGGADVEGRGGSFCLLAVGLSGGDFSFLSVGQAVGGLDGVGAAGRGLVQAGDAVGGRRAGKTSGEVGVFRRSTGALRGFGGTGSGHVDTVLDVGLNILRIKFNLFF